MTRMVNIRQNRDVLFLRFGNVISSCPSPSVLELDMMDA